MSYIILSLLIGLALLNDIKSRRISNWLVVSGMILGASCSVLSFEGTGLLQFQFGGLGLWHSLAGILAGIAIMLPLYVVRAMGAGDVKLMGAIGAFLGPNQIVGAVLLTFVAGGAISLFAAFYARSTIAVLSNLRLMMLFLVAGKEHGLHLSDVQTTGRLPYAIAIAFGTGLQIWFAARGNWPFA